MSTPTFFVWLRQLRHEIAGAGVGGAQLTGLFLGLGEQPLGEEQLLLGAALVHGAGGAGGGAGAGRAERAGGGAAGLRGHVVLDLDVVLVEQMCFQEVLVAHLLRM